MVPVAVVACAAWLFLFVMVLIVPPPPGPHRGGGLGGGRGQQAGNGDAAAAGTEAPAVVSLLAGRLGKLGFGATLADLAARGWFQVRGPDGGSGPVMCVVAAQPPGGALAPFERRVVAHVALRAGASGQVPASALADGFEGGEDQFMKAFKEEVDADARLRGLTRPRLTGRRIALLCVLLAVPAGVLAAAVAAAHRPYGLAWAGGLWLAGCWLAGTVGTSRRRTAAGQAALTRWQSAAAAAPGEGRLAGYPAASGDGWRPAYAAALGVAPAALAVFAATGKNTAWTSFRGGWQQLEIETTTWSWQRGCLTPLAILAGAGGLAWLARRATPPPLAEFDGQVIRQWIVKGDSDSPDEYHVAVDDGTRETAWDFDVGGERYRRLTPGTFVHVQVNLRDRADLTVAPVEPPAVARRWPGSPPTRSGQPG